ncbi:tRNA dimethylallyltransferase [Topomyia yanbarensis]|uniref:tRNA dimethylallyltransferase n=1 Tax=Topomyia yanbarensis TaxID=2498891 RepID=UPI00273C8381|nr:tRNA dimethylallyltransferase [Topomyia yanbarensis]
MLLSWCRCRNFRLIFHRKSATMASGSRVKPVVVILGSTGTGKTKLSIELARRFGGEIISADSMQVYRDLDIVTAKATREEQLQAPHHLLDVATPDQAFTVIHFRELALPIIDRLLDSDRVPIVVGGTNYYIESVLWRVLIGGGIREERGRQRLLRRVVNQQTAAAAGDHKRPKFATVGGDEQQQQQTDADAGSGVPPPRCVEKCDEKNKVEDYDNSVTEAADASASVVESESEGEKSETIPSAEEKKKVRVVESEDDRGDVVVAVKVAEDELKANEEMAAAAAAVEVDKVLLMTTEQMEQLESAPLHRVLRRIDPVTADRLHPNNKRKIIRALEVFQQDGQPLSRLLEEQRSQEGGCNLGGPLRYRKVVIFWLRCEQETLNARLDARVDAMVAQGLLAEIRLFYERYVKPYENNDFHRGILQSIGFKEFVGYLDKYDREHDRLITEYMQREQQLQEETVPPEGLELLQKCLDNLKLVTQRYSKRQLKWINHRFLSNLRREVPPIYALDTTDVSRWKETVSVPAQQVIETILAGEKPSLEPLPKLTSPHEGLNEETSFHCAICQRTIVGEYQWQLHQRSNKHKRCLQSRHKAARAGKSMPTTEQG